MILLSGVVIPVAFSLLRFVPFPGTLRSKFYAYIIEPPAFGSKHAVPSFFGMEIMPTRGQALFIGYFIVLNIVFSAVNIKNIQPNAWYPGPSGSWGNIIGTVTNRQGLLSFANLPLVFLYAGRNNVLLWVTNWSYSTFLLLHRWIAVIATLQAILHSLIWIKIKVHDKAYGTESVLAYWIYSCKCVRLTGKEFCLHNIDSRAIDAVCHFVHTNQKENVRNLPCWPHFTSHSCFTRQLLPHHQTLSTSMGLRDMDVPLLCHLGI